MYRALAVALGDPSLAAEAADEAMVRALARWGQVSQYDRPEAWTYRVGLNWATSQLRKWSLRPSRAVDELDRPMVDHLPDVDLADSLRRMDRKHRTVLVMRYFLQVTPDEIAEVLDVPVGTVKSRLNRGVQRLRTSMEVGS